MQLKMPPLLSYKVVDLKVDATFTFKGFVYDVGLRNAGLVLVGR